MFDGDDDGGQLRSEVAVGPVALRRRSHEAAAMDMEHEWQVASGVGFAVSRRHRRYTRTGRSRPGSATSCQPIVAPVSGSPSSARAAPEARKRFSASR
ncbi:hypothetical protein GCM10018790_51900 [Kitasatospora xanthocidica]|nr:hypothetical protein GCM10018790_51900 [Kitasatospora xanthocidica]